jgi:hypothetical protein
MVVVALFIKRGESLFRQAKMDRDGLAAFDLCIQNLFDCKT